MEARGEFTIEGCIEMAWMMGYIKHSDGLVLTGSIARMGSLLMIKMSRRRKSLHILVCD